MEQTLKDLVELRAKIKSIHKKTLDQAEFGFADHAKWFLLRSAINDAFGDRGLNSEITRVINRYLESHAGDHR